MISPHSISFSYWIHTLTLDFPNDIIPVVTDESQWREFGNMLVFCSSFATVGIPNTVSFSNWKDWAERVYALFG